MKPLTILMQRIAVLMAGTLLAFGVAAGEHPGESTEQSGTSAQTEEHPGDEAKHDKKKAEHPGDEAKEGGEEHPGDEAS